MLLDLKILNGNLLPYFDIYINNYTVEVENSVDELIIEYKVSDDYTIEILNNEQLQEGINYVYIELKNEEDINTYTLEVYKEETLETLNYEKYLQPLEVDKPMPSYMPFLIFGSCSLVIIVLFLLLFKRNKR